MHKSSKLAKSDDPKAHEKHPTHDAPTPFHGLQHEQLQALL